MRRQLSPPFTAVAVLLCGVTLALYWSGLRHPTLFDDAALGASPGGFGPRWLSDASFAWIQTLGGGDLLWQRLANLLLHSAAAVALYGFLSRLFGAMLEDRRGSWLALAGALWFVLHPAAVYGVAYLVQRSIVVATLFLLLALLCFLEGLLRRAGAWYVAAAASYALALFSKEHAVMAPAVAAMLAILVRGASRELARPLACAFAMLASGTVLVLAQQSYVLMRAYEPFAADFSTLAGVAQDPGLAYPLSVLNQATLFFRYLVTWLLPWPGWMSIDVRTPFPQGLTDWPYVAGTVAWLAYAAAGAALLLKRGRLALLGFGLLSPWLLALPEVATARLQEPFVLYRSYLWMSVLPAAFPMLLAPLSSRWRIGVGAVIAIAFALAALDRLASFSSALRLWDDAVQKNSDLGAPYVERAYINRGLEHLAAGRHEAARADIERAIELNPRSPGAHLARGTILLRSARLREALKDIDRAIALDPGYAAAYHKRCLVKMGLAGPALAIADCEKALALDPRNGEAWINVGAVYRELGRRADAAASYERALKLVPGSGSAHYNYGVLLLDAGRRDDAVRRHIAAGCDARIAVACEVLKDYFVASPGRP